MSTNLNFSLARYRFEWRVIKPIRMPEYAGSMLRGAFGHALRQVSCMTKQKDCTACPLLATCPYPAIFEPRPSTTHTLQKFSQLPVPYVIEPEVWGAHELAAGDTFSFQFVIIGDALKNLPLIVLAWRRALLRGVGVINGTADLLRVVHCTVDGEREVFAPDDGSVLQHAQQITLSEGDFSIHDDIEIILNFVSPLRLQRNGHALAPDNLDARTLLMALLRRANLLSEFHGGRPLVTDFEMYVKLCELVSDQKNLRWRDWTRFSSRQGQKMTLGRCW